MSDEPEDPRVLHAEPGHFTVKGGPAHLVGPGLVERFNALPENEPLSYRLTRGDLGRLVNSYVGLIEAVRAEHRVLEFTLKRDKEALSKALKEHSDGVFKAFDEFQRFLDNVLAHEVGSDAE